MGDALSLDTGLRRYDGVFTQVLEKLQTTSLKPSFRRRLVSSSSGE